MCLAHSLQGFVVTNIMFLGWEAWNGFKTYKLLGWQIMYLQEKKIPPKFNNSAYHYILKDVMEGTVFPRL